MRSTMTAIGRWTASALAGAATAIVIHYMLFRIGLPLKPFIYVVF
jgi:hypothetical protein